jgi:hypothetical protein
VLQIEIIARAVEIRGHRADVRSTMLSADRDKLGYASELCEREALVRRFERPGEYCILMDRLLGELGVDVRSAPEIDTVPRRWPRRTRSRKSARCRPLSDRRCPVRAKETSHALAMDLFDACGATYILQPV